VGGRVAITAVAEGARSPYLEELMPGFDDATHATALGKALLATLSADQRSRYLREFGMRPYTTATLTSPDALEADLAAGDKRGMHIEIGQYRPGVACASVLVTVDRDVERRVVLGCSLPAAELMTSARMVRTRLLAAARGLVGLLDGDTAAAPPAAAI
jgi:DNA-binding IclR family transcriptional regulator